MATRDNAICRSPVDHLRSIKLDKPIRKTPTFEEFKAIVTNIRSQQFNADAEESADFVEFIGLAGLGQAEASALRASDIDWQRETITTFRHKTKSGFAIPVYPQVRELLWRRCSSLNSHHDQQVFRIRDAKKAIAHACQRAESAPVQPPLIPPNVHHARNRARRGREGHCRMAGPQGRRQTDSRHLQPR